MALWDCMGQIYLAILQYKLLMLNHALEDVVSCPLNMTQIY